jgi:hypothetical protein
LPPFDAKLIAICFRLASRFHSIWLEEVRSAGKVHLGSYFLLDPFVCVCSCVRTVFWLIDLCPSLVPELPVPRLEFS